MPGELSEQQRNRIDELFAAAVNLSPTDQQAFVADETPEDPELRQHLEKLLVHANGASGRIAQIIRNVAQSYAPAQNWTGQRFGPYRVLREIGRGGMGIVFEAERDDHEYSKRVALKIASSLGDSELLQERFRHERQILAELEHPNIARLLDGGTCEGLPYFAMEYVAGSPITVFCRGRNLTLRQRVELFRQVCSAVESAHASLVIHRDLKPGNILVTEQGVPKLLDFGIAKLLDRAPAAGADTTGPMLWTPDYACPEQVRGKRVTTRSDVYSLGLILYELLCEERGQIADTSSPLAMDQSICDIEPPPPSERAARRGDTQLSARLRGDLDTIVGTSIRKEPERRYESVAALSEDLRRYLEGEPVLARPGTFSYKAVKFVRRHIVLVAASVLVVISLTAGIGVAMFQARRAERRFSEVRKLANTFLFDFHDRIQNLPGSTDARAFVLTTAVNYLDSLAREASNDSTLQMELAAAYQKVARVQGDGYSANLGQSKQAASNLNKSIVLAEQVIHRDPTNRPALFALAQGYSRLGEIQFWDEGKRSEGLAIFSKGQLYADKLIEVATEANDFEAFIDLHQRLAHGLSETDPQQALTHLERTIPPTEEAARRFNKALFRNLLVNTYTDMSQIYRTMGNPAKAVELLKLSLPITEELLQQDPGSVPRQNQVAVRLSGLATAYGDPSEFHLNDAKQALHFYHRAREMQERLVAADSKNAQAAFNLSRVTIGLARVYQAFDSQSAIRYGSQALEGIEALLRNNPKNMAVRTHHRTCLTNLGLALIAGGEQTRGLALLHRAVALSSELFNEAPEDLGVLEGRILNHLELGRVQATSKSLADAESNLAKAESYLAPLRKKLPTDLYFLRDDAAIIEAKGDLSATGGKMEQAKTSYREASRLWGEWAKLAVESPFTKLNLDRLSSKLIR